MTADGSPASRPRIFLRMFVTWFPGVLALVSLDMVQGLPQLIVGLGTNLLRIPRFTALLHGPEATIVALASLAVCL